MQTTKSRHRPNGPGVPATERFLATIVALEGGSAEKEGEELRLRFADGRPDYRVALRPRDAAAWESRLKWLEKSEAAVLLNPPIVYRMTWPARGGAGSGMAHLRLSVGLSISVGPPLSRRYTVTFARSSRRVTVEEGGELPSRGRAETAVLDALPDWAARDLSRVSQGVAKTCETYRTRPDVEEAVRVIGEKRRTELAYLEQLYSRRRGKQERLYGLPAPGMAGSPAIEAELRRLQGIVLERYAPRVRVRVLSLGVLQGDIPG